MYMCMVVYVYTVCICVWPCVYVYAVVFDWYLIHMSVRSGVLCSLDGTCVV